MDNVLTNQVHLPFGCTVEVYARFLLNTAIWACGKGDVMLGSGLHVRIFEGACHLFALSLNLSAKGGY